MTKMRVSGLVALVVAVAAVSGVAGNRGDFTIDGREVEAGTEAAANLAQELESWIVAANPPIRKVRIEAVEGMGFGLVATEPIRKGEIYFALPRSLLLGEEALVGHPLKPIFDEVFSAHGTNTGVLLRVLLMYERWSNPDSFYAAYIKSLPTSFDNPMYFNDEELAALDGSLMAESAAQDKRKIEREFTAVKSKVFDAYPAVFPPAVYNHENYKWAYALHGSRVINIQGFPGTRANFIPYIDMLNCKYADDTTYTAYDANLNAVVMHADEDYEAGDQVFETYGWRTGMEFLRYNAFVYKDNPNDCVYVKVGFPAKLRTVKKELLREYGVIDGYQTCVHSNGADTALMLVARVIRASKSEMAKIPHDKTAALSWNGWSAKTKAKANRFLTKLFASHRDGYPTTIEEDEALLAKDAARKPSAPRKFTTRMRYAVEYRLEEKRTLQKLIARYSEADKS